MKRALCLLLLLGCATVARPRDVFWLRITNVNYYAKTVRFDCLEGGHDFAVRGLTGFERNQRTRRTYNCPTFMVRIERTGHPTWRYPYVVNVLPGDEICVDIHAYIDQSSVWPCGRRAE